MKKQKPMAIEIEPTEIRYENGVAIPTHKYDDILDSVTIKPFDIVQWVRPRFIKIGRLRIRFGKRYCKYIILALPDKDRIFDDSDLVFYAVDLDCTDPQEYVYWHNHLFITEVEVIDPQKLGKRHKENLKNLLLYLRDNPHSSEYDSKKLAEELLSKLECGF